MDLLRDLCGSDGSHVFLYCGCTFLITIGFAYALARQVNQQEDCFGEKANKSLKEFNQPLVKEEFVNYESVGPDVVLVLRTDYKTALELNEAGVIDQVIGYSPVKYTIKTTVMRRHSV